MLVTKMLCELHYKIVSVITTGTQGPVTLLPVTPDLSSSSTAAG